MYSNKIIFTLKITVVFLTVTIINFIILSLLCSNIHLQELQIIRVVLRKLTSAIEFFLGKKELNRYPKWQLINEKHSVDHLDTFSNVLWGRKRTDATPLCCSNLISSSLAHFTQDLQAAAGRQCLSFTRNKSGCC